METKEEDEDWKEDFKENFEAGIKAKARAYMRTKVAQCVKFPEEIHLDAKGPIVLALSKHLKIWRGTASWETFLEMWRDSLRKECHRILRRRRSSIATSLRAECIGE